jgi:DNA-binding NarL/FixJ family response regulator
VTAREATGRRILLADSQVMFRQGVKALLEREGYAVIAEASDGHEAVRLTLELRPDVAVLDLGLPGLDGIEAAREIRRRAPGARLILLAMHESGSQVPEALRVGIRGYVLKSATGAELLNTIRNVAQGAIHLGGALSQVVIDSWVSGSDLSADALTGRELQVLQLIAEGKSNREAARILGLKPKTVESHRYRLMRKLGIHEVAGLVRYAIRRQLTTI